MGLGLNNLALMSISGDLRLGLVRFSLLCASFALSLLLFGCMHLQVLLKGGLVRVGLSTLAAEEHLLFGVDQLVPLQVARPAEAFAAV